MAANDGVRRGDRADTGDLEANPAQTENEDYVGAVDVVDVDSDLHEKPGERRDDE